MKSKQLTFNVGLWFLVLTSGFYARDGGSALLATGGVVSMLSLVVSALL